MPSSPSSSYRAAWLVFALAALFFCIGLGARPYLVPSEARYIEIPRQMLATGDWLTPRINGVPYFEKPPLFYWMQAAVMGVFGYGEFAGRIVTALFSAGCCAVTYAVAAMLYGRKAGLLSALMLATCLLGYVLSRVATLDVPVSFFITCTLGCFLAAQSSTRKSTPYLLMYAAAALGTMTKGLIGFVVPGLVIGAWIALTRRWAVLKEARLLTGLALFLLIAAPWHLLMHMHHPAFAEFYFIHEHFTRYLTDEHKRTAPWWFFLAVTVAGLMPWTALLPAAGKALRLKDPDTLFLALWVALPLIFYSTSHSKLLPYIFPIFPPLAILLGRHLALMLEGKAPDAPLRFAGWMTLGIFIPLLAALPMLPHLSAKIAKRAGGLSQIAPWELLPIALMLLALAYLLIRKAPAPSLVKALAAFAVVLGMNLNAIAEPLDTESTRPLAKALLPQLRDGDMVAAYGTYWQDLPVYLNRNITVVDWQGELRFGIEHYPETQAWMIADAAFWSRCAGAQHEVYVFARKGTIDTQAHEGCRLQSMAEYGKTELLRKITTVTP